MAFPLIPVLFGVASAGSSFMGHMGKRAAYDASWKSTNAQIKAQNYAAQRQYQYELQKQQQANRHALKVYEARVGQYKQQVGFNNQALADAYETEQIRLNEIADQVEAANFDSMVQLMSVQGFAAASGKQGRRAGMRDKSNAMQYGRNVARRLAGVDRATNAYLRNAEQLRVRTNNANQQAYAQVATAPMLGMAPLAPIARQMTSYAPPSSGAALANSLLDGVTAGVNFGAAIQ